MFSRFHKNKINLDLKPGDKHYRSFIGPPAKYDLVSAMQFNLLTKYGLRESHKLLDIGCGSLRGGRLFIIYLLENNYYGVEPEKWLVDDGIHYELRKEIVRLKKPSFSYDSDFNFDSFGVEFDFAIAQSIFTHASAEQIKNCMHNLSKVASKEFRFLASFIEGDKNYDGDTWVYPGCVTYTMDFMEKIICEYGFSCKKTEDLHPNNHTWLLIENN
ncbi:MAG: hypothetical protein M0Q29_02555 [Thiopseudomonas sp.]|nr:hypothetical protein [Thiopseudomonas sp.]MCK9464751.1 hypothetical protein [Thiopseudomonas sp.]